MKIRIFENKEELNAAFTDWLKEILVGKETLMLALSGGSTPKSLFDYWAENPEKDIDWKKIKFFWGDERCVPPTDEQSNYKMTKEHFFDRIPVPESNIFRIYGENPPEEEANRYAEVLKTELRSENGIPSFDVLMLGMGDDGHTASIFPQEIELWNSPKLCVVGTHPETGQKRVSLSGRAINAARNVAFLVTGENKAQKVSEIISHPAEAEKKYPAALVQPDSGDLIWFVDKAAASLLSQ